MPVDRISFPVETTLGGHDPVLTIVLVLRSGTEKDIEFGSVFRRNRTGDRGSSETRIAAGTSRKRDIWCSVDVSLRRETDAELKRRRVDVDFPFPEKLRKSLSGESL